MKSVIWKSLAAVVVILLVLIVGALLFIRHAVNDGSIPRSADLFAPGAPHTVMAVWAHPDDEITSAGTLARLTASGAKLTLVYLTHGEGAHFTGYSRQQLYAMRPKEAVAAGKALGTSDVVVLDYGDAKLPPPTPPRPRPTSPL